MIQWKCCMNELYSSVLFYRLSLSLSHQLSPSKHWNIYSHGVDQVKELIQLKK